MKTNMTTLNARESMIAAAMQQVMETAKKPAKRLCRYYSSVLERQLNLRQTWLLVNAQLAFTFAVLPVESPMLLRAACCGWFLHAVLKCKEALGE